MFALISNCILFFIFILTCLYLPGRYIFEKLKLHLGGLETIFYSIMLGLVSFTLLIYIVAFTNIPWLLYVIVLGVDILSIRLVPIHAISIQKTYRRSLLVVCFMSFAFSLTEIVNGQYGLQMNVKHDDLWHIALINELKNHFPPDFPSLSGVPLRGYHFFYDLLASRVSMLFGISPIALQFHYFPLFIAILWGLGVYIIMMAWYNNKASSLWAVFLTMFGGSFAYWLYLHHMQHVNLDYGLGMLQPMVSLYDPPFAISIIILLSGLFTIHTYLKTLKSRWLIPLILFGGMITMFKVYAGILMLGALVVLAGYEGIFKRTFQPILMLLGVIFLFLVTYGVFVGNQGFLIFDPYWPVAALLRSFPWYGYDEKMYTYSRLYVIHGIVETQAYGFIIFIFGNLGTRVIGLLSLIIVSIKRKQSMSFFSFLLLGIATVSVLLPLFFIQSGQVFEIIQMTNYYLFILALFAARGIAELFPKQYPMFLKILIAIVLLLFTLPSAYQSLRGTITGITQYQQLNSTNLAPYTFLSTHGTYNDIVLEIPNLSLYNPNTVFKWYENDSTPIITALGNKREYFASDNIFVPNIFINQKTIYLLKIIRLLKKKHSQNEINHLLHNQQIQFVYSSTRIPLFTKSSYATLLFHNNVAYIYSIAEK